MAEDLQAKIFLSCGQRKGTPETEIAHQIAERLEQLGYETYIAVEEQSLRGVKENIFQQLSTAEYFIFVDFKREKLEGWDACRGSLFCHQELALASYLDLPLLAFQQEGVMHEDGIMRFLQGNSFSFSSDRHLLPNIIADKVRQKGWNPRWKNALSLEQSPRPYVDAKIPPENVLGRFFHITVKNLNPYKTAINCYAYLETLRDLSCGPDRAVETVELKWTGYTLPNATIGRKSERHFDAFWISHHHPLSLNFNLFTDSTLFRPCVAGPGCFELTYVVISETFPPARKSFALEIGNDVERIYFAEA